MAVSKPKEYKAFRADGSVEIWHYNDIKDRNIAGFPTTYFEKELLEEGIPAFVVFDLVGLCESKGAARRLIKQGGGYKHLHKTKSPVQFISISKFDDLITADDFEDGFLYLRAGKNKLHKIEIK